MKSLLLIVMLFLINSFGRVYSFVEIQHYVCPGGHLCHDPFRPRDRLVLMPEKKLVKIEEEGEFRIYVENAFSTVLQDLKLLVTNPAFEIETVPASIARLVPGERSFYLVKLKLREGFKAGDYPLRISVEARSAVLRPSIETVEVVAEEVITEPPVQPVPEAIIPKVEPEPELPQPEAQLEEEIPQPPAPEVPLEEEVLIQEDIVEPLPQEMIEPQAEEAGEIVVRVEKFILAERWYIYLIPIFLLVGLLIWRRLRQK